MVSDFFLDAIVAFHIEILDIKKSSKESGRIYLIRSVFSYQSTYMSFLITVTSNNYMRTNFKLLLHQRDSR
jgi:hypothetical protein